MVSTDTRLYMNKQQEWLSFIMQLSSSQTQKVKKAERHRGIIHIKPDGGNRAVFLGFITQRNIVSACFWLVFSAGVKDILKNQYW